jgi:chemotaxis protein CheX
MQFAEADVYQLVESVWASVLGLEIQSSEEREIISQTPALAACIQITGAWKGAVALHCAAPLARHVAATMFGLEPGDITPIEIQDALGELVNMLGGNLKALIPEACHLSLPAVVDGTDYSLRIPGSFPINCMAFYCQEQPMLVTIMEREEKRV